MNKFKTTEDLYRDLTQYMAHKHFKYKFNTFDNVDIIELSDKGRATCFLRIRASPNKHISKDLWIGYTKANMPAYIYGRWTYMNAPLNKEEFKDAFSHQDLMYKLVNDMAVLGAIKPSHYPLVYDKVALVVAKAFNDSGYILSFYRDEIRSVKTFKTMVYKWMSPS